MCKKILAAFVSLFMLTCCSSSKKQADLIIHHANIYTVDSAFSVCQAMVVKEGKILAIGNNETILNQWTAKEQLNLDGLTVLPGLIDAHCHFLAYGLGLGRVDLTGTHSFKEILARVTLSASRLKQPLDEQAQSINSVSNQWIIGRGWDQNDWLNKEMPDNRELDSLFPDQPVFLTRIDGHAVLVNSKALALARIDSKTRVAGGEIVLKNNKPSGLLIDNAIDLVKNVIPVVTDQEKTEALLNAQDDCLKMGLTTIDDAGLMNSEVQLIDALQKKGLLKIRVYAMLSDSLENYKNWLEKGPYKTERLNVRSFKFYADGALGSRGACLYDNYADKKNWKGFLLSDISHFEQYAQLMNLKGFQMNTHCIGDSAFGVITGVYSKYCKGDGTKRWRIEHAQITAKKDLSKINRDIIPSVQPTHATSDMYWAAERLGKDRVKSAYNYKSLLQQSGSLPLGTDFPVEDISPFKTFYSAVFRQDDKDFPPSGFQMENALSKEETLRGMTIWAAYANFEEKEKGSIEVGKVADFVILDTDLYKCKNEKVLQTKVVSTYIAGERVYHK